MNSSKYIIICLLLSLVLLVASLALSVFSVRNNLLGFGYTQLIRYQMDKINRVPEVDVAIIGDSSAGNAINSKKFSEELNRSVISLPLTGSFGYSGTFFMLKKAIEKGANTILIMQSAKVLTGDAGKKSLIFLNPSFENIINNIPLLLSREIVYQSAVNTFKRLHNIKIEKYNNQDIMKHDYVPQIEPMNYDSANIRPDAWIINYQNLDYLHKISDLCAMHNVECLFTYGPIHSSFCTNNSNFIKKSNQIIAEAGLTLLDGMYCMNRHEIGDTINHIALKYKNKTTEYYAKQMQDYYGKIGKVSN